MAVLILAFDKILYAVKGCLSVIKDEQASTRAITILVFVIQPLTHYKTRSLSSLEIEMIIIWFWLLWRDKMLQANRLIQTMLIKLSHHR